LTRRKKVSTERHFAERIDTVFAYAHIIRQMRTISEDAVCARQMDLLRLSDVWLVWDQDTRADVGCFYFTRTARRDVVTIHGGLWDGKLAGKREILQALIDTRSEPHMLCPLGRDRKGKIWSWWLSRHVGFEQSDISNDELIMLTRSK
jgi:hypothetical protein